MVPRDPFDDFPLEIVTDIAVRDMVSSCPDFYQQMLRRYELGQVSRSVRNGSIGAISMWNVIEIHLWSNYVYIVDCLEKARGNLTLRFILHPFDNPPHFVNVRRRRALSQFHAQFIPLLGPFFHRVSRLEISARDRMALNRTLYLLAPYEWHNLQRIKLHDTEFGGGTEIINFPFTPPNILELRSVFPCSVPPTAYAHVTVLHIGGLAGPYLCDAEVVVDALVAAPNLQVLQLMDVRCVRINRATRVTLARVTHFLLKFDSVAFAEIATLLDLPAVEEFCICGVEDRASLQVVRKCCPDILRTASHLQLSHAYASVDQLPNVLGGLPNLQSVIIHYKNSMPTDITSVPIVSLPCLRMIILPDHVPSEVVLRLFTKRAQFHRDFIIVEGTGGEDDEQFIFDGSGVQRRSYPFPRRTRWISVQVDSSSVGYVR